MKLNGRPGGLFNKGNLGDSLVPRKVQSTTGITAKYQNQSGSSSVLLSGLLKPNAWTCWPGYAGLVSALITLDLPTIRSSFSGSIRYLSSRRD